MLLKSNVMQIFVSCSIKHVLQFRILVYYIISYTLFTPYVQTNVYSTIRRRGVWNYFVCLSTKLTKFLVKNLTIENTLANNTDIYNILPLFKNNNINRLYY